jgi:uncharacterized membrane protein YeaQ/YmgE (transglycosylase-associated protein family)
MLGWGLVGLIAGWMPRVLRNRFALAAFGIVCGFGFDWLMDVWEWSAFGPGADASSFVALVSAGIWFDVAHAAGNAVIALVAGTGLIRMLDRYDRRLHGSFAPMEGT